MATTTTPATPSSRPTASRCLTLMGMAIMAVGFFIPCIPDFEAHGPSDWRSISERVLGIIRGPMEHVLQARYGPTAHFVTTGAAEYFVCQMKAALVGGLFIASPWVLYQIWQFIAPGLYDHEKKYVTVFVWAGAFFFCAGAAFAYFFVFPPMYSFFVNQQPVDVQMLPSLEENFSFTLKLLVAFGIVFETPVVIFILSIAGIIDPSTLGKYRRYVVVVAVVIGAILTPSPDVYSQCLMAVPLLALYEFGVLVSRMAVKMNGTPLSRKDDGRSRSSHATTT